MRTIGVGLLNEDTPVGYLVDDFTGTNPLSLADETGARDRLLDGISATDRAVCPTDLLRLASLAEAALVVEDDGPAVVDLDLEGGPTGRIGGDVVMAGEGSADDETCGFGFELSSCAEIRAFFVGGGPFKRAPVDTTGSGVSVALGS